MALAERMQDEAAARLAAGLASYGLGVSTEDIFGRERMAHIVQARQVAMYLLHVGRMLSLARVAVAFGRDRSTVAHACHVIEDRRDDPVFDGWLSALEEAMRDAPPALPLKLAGGAR